ncbi:MAG: restriction endonuclease subunit S [Acidimicrobiaceae bacterium]|nr:restriction endonuclease subunit S [Acidimicrobiaceae bacterium]MYG55136.1 restriction endonuclease subunit S [Acidimicrobiaceae bacterium]MYJ98264.1 restriction endonuclease subunit S [Acidimicrobiaceae bacterium]
MIDARPDELEEISRILQEHVPEFEVRAYGSRAKWTSWDYSDLDLVVVAPTKLDFTTLVNLRSAFEESELRFSVDVMDWHAIPESFRQEIDREYVTLQVTNTEPSDVDLVQFTPLSYGKALKKTRRNPSGSIPVYGSNGIIGYHDQALTTGPTVVVGRKGSVGVVNFSPGPCWPIDTTFYHEESDSEIARFKYLTLSRLGLDQMNSDSAVPGLNRNNAHALQVRVPSIEDQRRIAGILGTLDDKIELNRRMSQTLEEMAQALFKSWFVDFDPVQAKSEGRGPALPARPVDIINGRFVESEVGLIPEDWRVGTLGEVAKETKSSVLPHSIASGTPYIGLAHMPKASIALSEWNWADHVESGKLAFRRGDILFGKLRPYFHKVGIAPIDGLCSTDIMVISPHSADTYGYLLGHVSSTMFVDYTNASSTGTRMPRTSWKVMSAYKVVIPPASVLKSFNDSISPMLDRIVANIHESFCLSNLRERLLPQLIDGKIPMASNERLPKGSKL